MLARSPYLPQVEHIESGIAPLTAELNGTGPASIFSQPRTVLKPQPFVCSRVQNLGAGPLGHSAHWIYAVCRICDGQILGHSVAQAIVPVPQPAIKIDY